MAMYMIDLSGLAHAAGIKEENLMEKLGMDGSVERDGAIECLRRSIDEPRSDTFEAFCWLAGHHIKKV